MKLASSSVGCACALALFSACGWMQEAAVGRPAPAAGMPSAQPEAVPVAEVGSRPLAEESLGEAPAGASDIPAGLLPGAGQELPQPVAPPDPDAVVASIGPTTPPQLATSIRLTDEGRRLLLSGDVAGALDRIEKAVKIDPANPHGYYWLAQVHYQRGRFDQALAFTDKAVVLFAGGDRAWLTQAYTFRASVLERAGRFRDARESYRRAVEIEPGNVAARAGLARLGEPYRP